MKSTVDNGLETLKQPENQRISIGLEKAEIAEQSEILLRMASYMEQLQLIIQNKLKHYFSRKKEASLKDWIYRAKGPAGPFEDFVQNHQLGNEEILLLLIALAPHVHPDFYDQLIQENIPQAGDFPALGGIRGKQFRGFLPTGQTALFIIAGEDSKKQVFVQHLLSEDHLFAQKRILWLDYIPEGEPRYCGKLVMSPELVDLFTVGKVSRPRFSLSFPAQRLNTRLNWNDLVLNEETRRQIKELEIWIRFNEVLTNTLDMGKRLKPGYRALFHGPPGTGKTLTASLLGKFTKRDVYRVDLSMVVSKYIGETEKNLHNLFAKAENKEWVLFFDEADALFGKRTNVKDAHDKYANQEVSYLLQRIEEYNGLTILASNFKSNIDDAFMRRFQTIIHFPMPKVSERLQLWKQSFPLELPFAEDVDIAAFSRKYELSGSNIINIAQYSCLQALHQNLKEIPHWLIEQGIRKEYQKENKIMH